MRTNEHNWHMLDAKDRRRIQGIGQVPGVHSVHVSRLNRKQSIDAPRIKERLNGGILVEMPLKDGLAEVRIMCRDADSVFSGIVNSRMNGDHDPDELIRGFPVQQKGQPEEIPRPARVMAVSEQPQRPVEVVIQKKPVDGASFAAFGLGTTSWNNPRKLHDERLQKAVEFYRENYQEVSIKDTALRFGIEYSNFYREVRRLDLPTIRGVRHGYVGPTAPPPSRDPRVAALEAQQRKDFEEFRQIQAEEMAGLLRSIEAEGAAEEIARIEADMRALEERRDRLRQLTGASDGQSHQA